MERSEKRRSSGQIALGLCDSRLCHEGIHVVWCDIENLVKLPQCFGKTTKADIGKRVLGEQVNIARVEPLGFVEIRLRSGPIGLASARHRRAIPESGCYWAGADVLAQSNAPQCRNP